MKMRAAAATLLASALALTLSAAGEAGSRTGVLDGHVVRPAETIACVRPPCLEPVAGLVVTVLRDGLMVSRPRTDLEGRFRLRLLPGRYTVRNPRFATDRTVTVVAAATRRLEIRLPARATG